MRRSYEVLTEGLDMIGPVAIEKRLPHVPIPNTTVKRFLADGTALRVRESRSLPDFFFSSGCSTVPIPIEGHSQAVSFLQIVLKIRF